MDLFEIKRNSAPPLPSSWHSPQVPAAGLCPPAAVTSGLASQCIAWVLYRVSASCESGGTRGERVGGGAGPRGIDRSRAAADPPESTAVIHRPFSETRRGKGGRGRPRGVSPRLEEPVRRVRVGPCLLKAAGLVTAEQTPRRAGGASAAVELRQVFSAVKRVGASPWAVKSIPTAPFPSGRVSTGVTPSTKRCQQGSPAVLLPSPGSRGTGRAIPRGREHAWHRAAAGCGSPISNRGDMGSPAPKGSHRTRSPAGLWICGVSGRWRGCANATGPRGARTEGGQRSELRLMLEPAPSIPAPRGAARIPAIASSAGENLPRHFTACGKSFEPLPCHTAFSYLFACWLFHAELARMTFPAQLPSCFRLFYQQIQLENGYHLAEKQTEKHIFVSKTLMIGRIAPISA